MIVPPSAEIARPLRHFVEFTGTQRLTTKRDGGLETEHLKLALTVTKEWAHAPGGGFTTEQAVLRITNKTDKYLAYRVVTAPSDARRCHNKAELVHNAIALTPGEEVARTECAVDPTTSPKCPALSGTSYIFVTRGLLLVCLSRESIAFHNAAIKARRWEKYYLARVAAARVSDVDEINSIGSMPR